MLRKCRAWNSAVVSGAGVCAAACTVKTTAASAKIVRCIRTPAPTRYHLVALQRAAQPHARRAEAHSATAALVTPKRAAPTRSVVSLRRHDVAILRFDPRRGGARRRRVRAAAVRTVRSRERRRPAFPLHGPGERRPHRGGRRRSRRPAPPITSAPRRAACGSPPTAAKTFAPVFDDQPVQAIGALAVAPSDPRIVWAGTGEAWAIRDSRHDGRRRLQVHRRRRDVDATWASRETGRIGRIIVHPTNPNIVYVCALGRATGPQQERGVYQDDRRRQDVAARRCSSTRTPAAPASRWTRTIRTCCSPARGRSCMHTWAMFSGGPGSGVYMTHDGGATWKQLETRAAEVAGRQDRRRDRAVELEARLRADSDRGSGLALALRRRRRDVARRELGRALIGRAGYYIRIDVNPANADEVLIANSSFHRSLDGGATFPIDSGGGCGDCHDIWMDPKNPRPLGRDRRRRHGHHHRSRPDVHAASTLPIGQMYHVAVDNQVPYWIYSNRQDNGTMRGPSNAPVAVAERAVVRAARRGVRLRPRATRRAAAAGAAADGGGGVAAAAASAATPWEHGLGGCESGFTLPDPTDPDIVWATCYGNEVTRWDARTKRARSVSPWMHTLDSPPNELEVPLPLDAAARDRSVRSQHRLLRLPGDLQDSNGGQSWTVISPDLSTQRSVSASSRPAASSATTSASSTARSCSRSRRRRSSAADLGRHERRQGLVHARRRRDVERRHEEHHRAAGVGHGAQDRAVALRRRRRRTSRRLPHDGRPRAVHLQDDRLRQDVDEASAATCRRRIRSTT